MAANVEEFILRLQDQVTPAASAASGALARLESQIRQEQSALAALEASMSAQSGTLGSLNSQLDEVSDAWKALYLANDGSKEAAAALKEQGAAAAALETQIKRVSAAYEGTKAKAAGKGDNLSKLQGALPKLQGQAVEGDAAAKLKQVEAAAKAAGGEAKEAAPSFKQLGAAAGETDGPLGNMVRAIGKFKAAGPAGAVLALVGVLLLVVTAAITAAIALTRFALAAADAARSSALMSNAAAGGAAVGAELEAVINDVAGKTPLARDKIAEMGRAMEIAHLAGRNMQNALEAAATATSAVGDAAGASFKTIAEASQKARRFLLTKQDLEGTGVAFADVAAALATQMGITTASAASMIQRGAVSVKDGLEAMNAAVQGKFGKTVGAQMLALDTQVAKMKESFARLFDGVDIEPFLRGLKTITDLFREDSSTGAALHTLFVSLFNPLADASSDIFPVISAFIRGMILATLDCYIAFLLVKKAINDAFGSDTTSKIDWIQVGMYAGMIAVASIGAVLVGLAFIIGIVILGVVALTAIILMPFIVAAAAVYALIAAFSWITTTLNDAVIGGFRAAGAAISGAFNGAIAYLESIDLGAAAGHIIDSLVNGLKSAVGKVGEAMKSIGKTILAALPDVLKMHSPSVLLTAQAEMAAGSVVNPLRDAKDDAHKAMADLGGGRPDFAGSKGGAPKGGAGGRTFTFASGAIVFQGARRDLAAFRRDFADMIEQVENESPEPTT